MTQCTSGISTWPGWQVAVSYIDDNVHFGKDLEVSTFEVNIRSLPWIRNSEHETTPLGRVKQHNRGILGGLLSGHLHAQKILSKYAGGLLEKARHGLCSNVSGTYKKAEGTDQSSQARASCDEDRSNRPVQQSEGWQYVA